MKSFKKEDPIDVIPDISIPGGDDSRAKGGQSNTRSSLSLPPQAANDSRLSPGLFPHGVVHVHGENHCSGGESTEIANHDPDPFRWIQVDSIPGSPTCNDTHSMSPTLRTALVSVTRSNDSLSGLV